MELKMKYQTSYFIYPYIVREQRYKKYINKMLKNKKFKFRMFEKNTDIDLYEYFLPIIRNNMFFGFNLKEEEKKNLKDKSIDIKANVLSKTPCVMFEYKLHTDLQAKTGDEEGIFFKIQKIEVICFNTGICFIVMKTNIEGSNNFSDLLDFNYKFRDINSELKDLTLCDNIRIQSNNFSDIKEMKELIKEITGDMEETQKTNLDINRFCTYSYVCLEQEYWSTPEDFKNIEKEFFKYTNILPSDFNSKFDNDKLNIVNMGNYIKIGITNMGANMITSSINVSNYTKLHNDYENKFLYTYILNMYKSIFLKKILRELKEERNTDKIRKKFIKFSEEIWINDMINDDNGVLMTEELSKTLGLEETYDKVKKQYDLTYKELKIEKNININKILLTLLGISLVFNIINFILLISNM